MNHLSPDGLASFLSYSGAQLRDKRRQDGAAYQEDGARLIEKAKRQKTHKPLKFPFYSLLQGWQRLFASAKTIFTTGGGAPPR